MPLDITKARWDGDIRDIAKFDFPVEMRTAFHQDEFGEFHEAPADKCRLVVRTDTNDVLGKHGKSYHVTPYGNTLEQINEVLGESLDLSNVQIEDHLIDNGARMRRDIIFKDYTIEPKVDDIVAFRVSLFNSYDGGWAWQVAFSGLRLWCSNGCTTADFRVRNRQKHTSIINLESQVKKMQNAIEAFQGNEEVFRHWIKKQVSKEEVEETFKKTLAFMPKKSSESKNFSEPLLEELMKIHDREMSDNGSTVWAAYNTATYWATHVQQTRIKATANTENTRRQREDSVAKMMGTESWLKLAA